MRLPSAWDESSVSEALAEDLRGRWLWCNPLGGWFGWDGRRWKLDTSERILEEVRQWIHRLVPELGRLEIADRHDLRQAYRLRRKGTIEAVARLAARQDGIRTEAEAFDRHPHLLCAGNGVIDLRDGTLIPHDPGLRLTQATEVNYHPSARHEDVEALLEIWTPSVRAWMQAWTGMAAFGRPGGDLLPVATGGGANGKTAFLEALLGALGDYAWPADADLVTGDRKERTSIAALRGRRVVWIDETAEDGRLKIEAAKKLTGNSTLTARFLYRDEFTFTPTHSMLIATNHRPNVNATDYATWRRLRIVPFPFRYVSEADPKRRPSDRIGDAGLKTRLREGREQREAMLAWVVDGAMLWHSLGLPICDEITNATDGWRDEEDVIRRFIEDRCIVDREAIVAAGELFRAYRAWCETENRLPGSAKAFHRRLSEHEDFETEDFRTKAGKFWRGIGLAEDEGMF